MRSTKFLLTLLAFAATMLAADPFTGTWKMDPAKTKYKTGVPPKEQTIVINEAGADLSVKITGTLADGSKMALSYTVPLTGGTGKITEGTAYDGISAKVISAKEREISYMKGGKTVYTSHPKISANGKSLVGPVKGANALGQTVEGTIGYTKQ